MPGLASAGKGIDMGLFDFFRRKKPQPNPDDEFDRELEEALGALDEEDEGPTPAYVFAHYALRQIALDDPLQFLAIVASPEAEEFIGAVLEDVEEQVGGKIGFDAAAVTIHLGRAKRFPCAVIELPEPKESPEAFMVALVALFDPENGPPPDSIEGRFFTLEKGASFDGESWNVLAEWTADGGHSNFGAGPAPELGPFVAAISEKIELESAPAN
ncbi:MAG: hypothetical protein AAGM22_30875 [Acidobacteriota bacterium]